MKKKDAHTFEREPNEHYAEPRWCNRVLFENEHFNGFVHDPCCGWGRIPEAARAAGIKGVTGGDIVDRGFDGVGIKDFLNDFEHYDNVVCNPPFKIIRPFVEHAVTFVVRRKVVVMMGVQTINAASWMRKLRLQHIWFLTPRPSMPPGYITEQLLIGLADAECSAEPSGGTKDYCWAVFDNTQPVRTAPTFGWLHRDKGVI